MDRREFTSFYADGTSQGKELSVSGFARFLPSDFAPLPHSRFTPRISPPQKPLSLFALLAPSSREHS